MQQLDIFSIQIEPVKSELSSRQWKLYNLLKRAPYGEWTTQDEILDMIPEYRETNRKSHDKCPTIWSDIQKINFAETIEKIIIIDNFKYKLAENQAELKEYADMYMYKALLGLERYHNITRKMGLNGQMKIVDHRGKVIDGTTEAREYIETYKERRKT